jgi:hypothetical protein
VVIRYPVGGAGISHYAFLRRDSVVATMPSGEEQLQLLGRTAYLTITWIAADSGTKITALVDSIVADTGLGMAQAQLDSARGTRWTALRLPTGNLSGLTGTRTSLAGDQVRDQLALLFPHLPPDGARPGATWTDSTEGPARVIAFEATEIVLRRSEAGQTLVAGALPIQVASTRTAMGQGTQFGQAITVKGNGADTLAYQLAAEGRVLSVEGSRRTSLVVELSAIGQSVQARETSVLRMTLVH